jgi:hypothetical protein
MMKLAGHVSWIEEKRKPCRFLVEKPEEKNQFVRPKCR